MNIETARRVVATMDTTELVAVRRSLDSDAVRLWSVDPRSLGLQGTLEMIIALDGELAARRVTSRGVPVDGAQLAA